MTRWSWLLLLCACTGAVGEMPDGGTESVPDASIVVDAGHQTSDAGAPVRDGGLPELRTVGRQLLVDGSPIEIRAVGWNPVRKGGSHPNGLDFSGDVERDAAMMAAAGFNAVRT